MSSPPQIPQPPPTPPSKTVSQHQLNSARSTKTPTQLTPAATDIVTETDKAVENLVATRLIAKYPTYDFIGEESYDATRGITTSPTFLVDPIDGTSNFVHHFPSVTISLALLLSRHPAIGVIYNPFLDELFTAVRGAGAWHSLPSSTSPPHPLPLHASPLRGLQNACIGLDVGTARSGPRFALNARVFATLARSAESGGRCVRALRATGSAAESICRVAAGQLDAFWEAYGCGPWDFAAAWCVLREAGGVLVDAFPPPGHGGGGEGGGGWPWPVPEPAVEGGRVLAVRAAGVGQREFVGEFWGVVAGEGGLAGER